MTADTAKDAAARLTDAGQDHLVAHAEGLDPETRDAFLVEAAAHPWDELRKAFRSGAHGTPSLRPPQVLTLPRQEGQPGLRRRLAALGEGLLRGGRAATLLLAGGQGTRLGYDGPKGCLTFGPEADRSLYRIHAERVAAASEKAGKPVPFYLLVSPATRARTEEAFADCGAWGLSDDQVTIIEQAQLPCLDNEGRAVLAGPGQLALAPDGHGGAFSAIAASGVIRDLHERGVDVLTTFQVDNPLSLPLDPVMLGWMVERRLHAVGKAVRKATLDEKVGIFARDVRGRQRVVEYTELEQIQEEEATIDGVAGGALDMGSIAIHGFSVAWLNDLVEQGFALPLHKAHKKVPFHDAAGVLQQPDAPNAWKLERFIFDLFPEAPRAEVHEVERTREFAPVKNAEGVDSLVTARLLADAEVRRWYRERGLDEPEQPSLRPRELVDAPPTS